MSYNSKASAVRCGSGVPRQAVEESDTMRAINKQADEQQAVIDGVYTDKATGRRFKLNSVGQAKKSSTPILKDQYYSTVQGMVTFDPPVDAVFDLSVKEDLDAFNKLQAHTFPVDGPHVVFINERDEFYQGKFVKLVKYSYVWYLMPEPK